MDNKIVKREVFSAFIFSFFMYIFFTSLTLVKPFIII